MAEGILLHALEHRSQIRPGHGPETLTAEAAASIEKKKKKCFKKEGEKRRFFIKQLQLHLFCNGNN